ncbi:MAG: minor capsid protein [Fervidobacterium sp.]
MILQEIGQFLQAKGIGTLGINIFLGQLPAKPDDIIAIFEYAGEPPDLHWQGEYPRVQVMVRNISYEKGREKIEEVKNILHGLSEKILDNKRYLLIQALQSPFFMQRDENSRAIFVCNFKTIKEVG